MTATTMARWHVGRTITALLDQAWLTHREFARLLGVHPSTVDDWCSATHAITAQNLEIVAAAFGLTSRQLLDGEDARTNPRLDPRSQAGARLAMAGLTGDRARQMFEVYCLMCGRGTGPGGALQTNRKPPMTLPPCATCGGRMLVREYVSEASTNEMRDAA